MNQKTYLVEELFQDIPNDPDNVLFTIPPEICEHMDWYPGDTISIEVTEGKMTLSKV